MTNGPVGYVQSQIINHARIFFNEPAAELLQSDAIRFLSYTDAVTHRGRQIVIPVDLPVPPVPEAAWKVPFNGTTLTLWNRVPRPDSDQWRAIPNDKAPVWYQHESGTLMPVWNMFGNVFDLLTFGEEQRSSQRDHHGRFAAAFSPRLEPGLLEVPAVNESVALLVAAVVAISRTGQPSYSLDCLAGPPVVILSHDCDALAGNDFWTQSVRLYRFLQPLLRLRLPRPSNLWWFLRNVVTPRRFYFDNVTGMVDIERCFGAVSTFYMLNGSRGRFGARSPFRVIPEFLEHVPPTWDIGIHYNYDTFLNPDRFAAQLEQLQKVVSAEIVSGRAHYLRFDPFKSFHFLRQFGIYVDESSGWSDHVGYRNGIAGCFQAYDADSQLPFDIWEVPMIIMEDALIKRHGTDAVNAVERHLHHLGCVGGALTLLVHPGQFFNPEHRPMLGIYHELLKVCRRLGAISRTAKNLVDELRR